MNTSKVPEEPLPIAHTSSGLLSDIAVHFRGGLYHLESSYSHFGLFGFLLVLACIAIMWPVGMIGPQGIDVRYAFALMFVWGGLCGVIPYFIRNRFGVYLTFDPSQGRLRIHQPGGRPSPANIIFNVFMEFTLFPANKDTDIDIAFADIIALQIAGSGPFQANLVYLSGDKIQRFNVAQHAAKSRIRKIVDSVACIGPFEIIE